MSHNNQKKIAAINDYSGFGRCSIAVELPIISALKVQCCPLPTSILSNHTGFESFYFEDFTESMPAYIKEWEKLNLKFDGICTGFLGSHKQIEIVRYFFDIFKTPDNIVVVDPVMGDYGNLYATYTKETCEEMKKLVSYANILTPNLTEACILTGREYNAEYGNEELETIAKQLSDMGPSKIVITGIVAADIVVADGVTDSKLIDKNVSTIVTINIIPSTRYLELTFLSDFLILSPFLYKLVDCQFQIQCL